MIYPQLEEMTQMTPQEIDPLVEMIKKAFAKHVKWHTLSRRLTNFARWKDTYTVEQFIKDVGYLSNCHTCPIKCRPDSEERMLLDNCCDIAAKWANKPAKGGGSSMEASINHDIHNALIALQARLHDNAVKHSRWDNYKYVAMSDFTRNDTILSKLMSCVSELGGACEAVRQNRKPDEHVPKHENLTVKMADCVIRLFDLAGWLQLDLGSAILDKYEYNKSRIEGLGQDGD